MSAVIYIAKFIFTYLVLVALDRVWNRMKSWKRNRAFNKIVTN